MPKKSRLKQKQIILAVAGVLAIAIIAGAGFFYFKKQNQPRRPSAEEMEEFRQRVENGEMPDFNGQPPEFDGERPMGPPPDQDQEAGSEL